MRGKLDVAPSKLEVGITSRLQAYAILTHHHLNEINENCCPICCAPCMAILYLLNDGVLDEVIKNWETYTDGTPVLQDGNPTWWKNGSIDKDWLRSVWRYCDLHQKPIVVPFGNSYQNILDEDESDSMLFLGEPVENVIWTKLGEEQEV